MKNTVLSEESQKKLDVIRKVSDGNIDTGLAASLLDLSRRQIYRLVAKYKQNGKAAFVHGNTGRKPKMAFSDEKIAAIAEIYKSKYYDNSFVQATELMAKHDGIIVSATELGKIVRKFGITSPRTRRLEAESKANIIKNAVKNAILGKFNTQNCLVFIVPCPDGGLVPVSQEGL